MKHEFSRRAGAGAGPGPKAGPPSIDHYLKLVLHRKWVVLVTVGVVSCASFFYAQRLPNIFSSETLILVDPQKVPEAYVKSTVTGDIRDRLGTLSQQILSATRLQKIIETFNLYPVEQKTMAREDIIGKMRGDIHTSVANDFGGGQDLQAFRISYRGRDPRVVAQVANQLASLFIEENLKAREEQATGTTEFLTNQLQETRKALEEQEGKLKDFKLKHLGEMPEQQTANLQILGQLQQQLQSVNDSIGRAEQQKTMLQSLMAQGTPTVVEIADSSHLSKSSAASENTAARPQTQLEADKATLQSMLGRFTENHPDVRRLKARIAQEEVEAAHNTPLPAAQPAATPQTLPAIPAPPVASGPATAPSTHYNPVLQAQLQALDAEIAKQREEQRRLTGSVAAYRTKVEAIPVREQQIADLQRDYDMSKAHYATLLDKQLSAETATELEIRQKGEKFTVLDPAVPADRPSSPNRRLIDSAGVMAGLGLGLVFALCTELFGLTVIESTDVASPTLAVLEVIPLIQTRTDQVVRKKRLLFATASAVFIMAIVAMLYLFGPQSLHM
jgi:protein tyrosine kinase modulator